MDDANQNNNQVNSQQVEDNNKSGSGNVNMEKSTLLEPQNGETDNHTINPNNEENGDQIRKDSSELENDMKRMAELKEQRERETQEVKKREAMPSYNTLLTQKCKDILKEAKKFLEKGAVDDALTKLTKLIMIQPSSRPIQQKESEMTAHELAEPYQMRAEIYLDMCDFESAVLNYKKVCHLLPDEPEHFERLAFIYFFYGQVLFDQGQFPEALECFSRAAEMRPDTVGYHTRSIACLASLQRHGECLALVNRRIEAESDNPDLFVMRARLHQLFGNSTLCYYDVRDALELDPDLEQAKELRETLFQKAIQLKNQAIVLMLENKLPEAQSKMSQAIDNDPTVAELHVLRGAVYRRLGKFNNAVDDFLLALDKTDHNESSPVYQNSMRQLILSYNDFAIECYHKRFFEESVSLLNKAIRAEKGEKGLYINRGDCFFQMKNYQFALADYQQALDLDKDDWDIKSRISLIFNEFAIMDYFERRYLEAEEKFTFALQHNPKVSQYYISRARVRHLLDFKKGAREDVLCAMHLSPSNEELFSLIARLFPGKQIAEIRASGLFQATARRLHDAFQMSAPKKPKLRPLSAASLTTQLAGELSNEIHVLAGPSTSSATSRSLQRSAGATTSRSQRSGGVKGIKNKKTSSTSASRLSGSKQGSKYDKDVESLRNESSIAGNLRSRSGQKGVKTPVDDIYDDFGRDSASLLAAISPAEFFEQKKRVSSEFLKFS